MAAGWYRPGVSLCIILMLASQVWSGAAYSNQQSKWLTKHLSEGSSGTTKHRADRHLQESTTKATGKYGFRAALVNEDHKLHARYNLSSMERIFHGAEKSRSRAWALESKARAAPYYRGSVTGRKVLQVVESPTTTPTVAPAEAPSYESPVEATPGSYSMAFSVGTPPQNFIAIADTGSDLVWIQGAACTVCFDKSSPGFDPANSTTYSSLGCSDACSELGSNEFACAPACTYTYAYGDQSTTQGDYVQDTVTLEIYNETTAIVIPGFNFGYGLQNNGTFTDTDGIVGLARGPISFPSQIAPYLNNATKFSYCLLDKLTAAENDTSPLIFGEDAVPANFSAVLYTPIQSPYNVSDVPYYYVNLQGITVGETNLSIPATAFQLDANGMGGTIFDSGTTYTSLTTDAYNAVANEYLVQLTDYPAVDLSAYVGLEVCFDITGFDLVSIPGLTFHFENADFDLPFDNIMIVFGDGRSTYMCLSVMGGSGINIYGNNQQQNFQVVYEEDLLRIGWLPLDCSTL